MDERASETKNIERKKIMSACDVEALKKCLEENKRGLRQVPVTDRGLQIFIAFFAEMKSYH
ncbi:hypothetical protein Pyn_00999 [Prunus yedoensis var. nudiflora]|uniref:Uncharacterized protein n=1 Tax=Prunus yedoensis var. nudiflora TaxID=2094558 RepID=A0A314UG74_PRUYE|nr:hypothetical protein Pyn_00999 [Prunus yedoensis var. nudiflora]